MLVPSLDEIVYRCLVLPNRKKAIRYEGLVRGLKRYKIGEVCRC
jgi:hypothetical protein